MQAHSLRPIRVAAWLACASLSWGLSACGGGSSGADSTAEASSPNESAQAVTTFELSSPEAPNARAQAVASTAAAAVPSNIKLLPSFHVAPVELDAPSDADKTDHAASAHQARHTAKVPSGLEGVSTQGLTLGGIRSAKNRQAAGLATGQGGSNTSGSNAAGTVTPAATSSTVSTYTPAQIRAAYGLPDIPASLTGLTAAQAAQLGAGQTIYIVDAYHNPNVAAELAAFNQKFGLPTCQSVAASSVASTPAGSACSLAVAYSTAAGGLSSTAPAYDSGWATEIALDVQWAHAIAPLARIVLIEASDAGLTSLVGAVQLANNLGPGVVSMSFGAQEGSWTSSVNSVFTTSRMTYLAATGDNGTQVCWPAVSPNVIAVGGTSLSYTSGTARSETAWSGSGGGSSQYTAAPSYQSSGVPGMGSLTRRAVPDVAMNANPYTGQYVAVIAPGSTTASWISAGGTSMSTPQWAGLVAVANAQRVLAGKTVLGQDALSVLYKQIGAVPGTYASTFLDVNSGSNGTCTTCSAVLGFDLVTGLGSPNTAAWLTAVGASTSGTSSTSTGTTAGTTTGSTGSTGSTSTSTGTGSTTGSTGGTTSSTLTITATGMTGVVGKAMSGSIALKDPGATSFSMTLAGSPAGVQWSVSGTSLNMSWAKPVQGQYTLTVSAKDNLGHAATSSIPLVVNAK